MNKWVIIAIVATFSLGLRLWNLNMAGQTWDEFSHVDTGYKYIELLLHGDLTDHFWTDFPDQPPLARYFYGVAAHLDTTGIASNGQPIYQYDWTNSRCVSVLFSIGTIILTTLMGWEYVSPFVGITAGIILAMLPVFLGLSQLVTLETVFSFFFTASTYAFLHFLKKSSLKKLLLTGVLIGLAVSTKITDILLVPMYVTIVSVWKVSDAHISFKKLLIAIAIMTGIAGVVFFIVWPALLLHPLLTWQKTAAMRFTSADSAELFFGKNILSPWWYFLFYFLTTTPFLIVLLCILGMVQSYKKKNYFFITLFAWFFIPFLQSFYHDRTNGIRYIIEIYIPIALFSAIAVEKLIKKWNKNVGIKICVLSSIIIYLFIVDASISPYYLSYFNQLVGGPANVYKHTWFPLAWWGEGQREAATYVAANGFSGMKVGLQLVPKYVIPSIQGAQLAYYTPKERFDYVIVNYLYDIRAGFNEKSLDNQYELVYQVMASGAPIVDVYKHK